MTIQLYDAVTTSDWKDPLTSGHMRYTTAIVVSLDPFVLKSASGDMTWHHRTPGSVKVVASHLRMPFSLRISEQPFLKAKQVTLVLPFIPVPILLQQLKEVTCKSVSRTDPTLLNLFNKDLSNSSTLVVHTLDDLLTYNSQLKDIDYTPVLGISTNIDKFKHPIHTCLSVIGLQDDLDKMFKLLSPYE